MQNRFGKSKTGPGSRPAVKPLAREGVGNRRSIFLVGFMGAGKTTVGRALSRRLSLPFEDLDDRIQQRERKTIERDISRVGRSGISQNGDSRVARSAR